MITSRETIEIQRRQTQNIHVFCTFILNIFSGSQRFHDQIIFTAVRVPFCFQIEAELGLFIEKENILKYIADFQKV